MDENENHIDRHLRPIWHFNRFNLSDENQNPCLDDKLGFQQFSSKTLKWFIHRSQLPNYIFKFEVTELHQLKITLDVKKSTKQPVFRKVIIITLHRKTKCKKNDEFRWKFKSAEIINVWGHDHHDNLRSTRGRCIYQVVSSCNFWKFFVVFFMFFCHNLSLFRWFCIIFLHDCSRAGGGVFGFAPWTVVYHGI